MFAGDSEDVKCRGPNLRFPVDGFWQSWFSIVEGPNACGDRETAGRPPGESEFVRFPGCESVMLLRGVVAVP